ncbi:MAG: hypothetical protein KKH41_07620 [Candidatus Thermoplasmatota archaeon]|nr:hypothetical protein [Candidatus Thermoplasmatota archaeon]MBU4071690.1 hypothetical protein [Candidatus Thermoplasmatota archaeon]MBU4143754.1 hypothetical protein [Candidatus Thermoplasmatota archaeon]MBU4592437.1 hypothetical protein [Candidatus Thermoplasmatota archaeon]
MFNQCHSDSWCPTIYSYNPTTTLLSNDRINDYGQLLLGAGIIEEIAYSFFLSGS